MQQDTLNQTRWEVRIDLHMCVMAHLYSNTLMHAHTCTHRHMCMLTHVLTHTYTHKDIFKISGSQLWSIRLFICLTTVKLSFSGFRNGAIPSSCSVGGAITHLEKYCGFLNPRAPASLVYTATAFQQSLASNRLEGLWASHIAAQFPHGCPRLSIPCWGVPRTCSFLLSSLSPSAVQEVFLHHGCALTCEVQCGHYWVLWKRAKVDEEMKFSFLKWYLSVHIT